jgi:hypothetical protein
MHKYLLSIEEGGVGILQDYCHRSQQIWMILLDDSSKVLALSFIFRKFEKMGFGYTYSIRLFVSLSATTFNHDDVKNPMTTQVGSDGSTACSMIIYNI